MGSANSVSMKVTDAATPMLRSATVRYTGSVRIAEVVQRRLAYHLAGEPVDRPQRRREQYGERAEVGDHQPQQRRGQQPREAYPGMPVKPGGECAERAAGGAARRTLHRWRDQGQPLVSGPGPGPGRVVLAGHAGTPVEALRGRGGPVPELRR